MRIVVLLLVLLSEFSFAQAPNEYISIQRSRTRASGFYWLEKGATTIAGLTPYLWLDASSDTYFLDTSGNTISCTAPSQVYIAKTWLDRSGNDRDFSSPTNASSPKYNCDSNTPPSYLYDANLQSDGVDDTMTFNFTSAPAGTTDGLSGTINSDFTFIFVMQAINDNPSQWDSFIASGDSPTTNGTWQIGVSTDTSNFYFASLANTGTSQQTTKLTAFDTNPHVYFIQRSGNNIIFKIDGNLVGTVTFTNTNRLPQLSLLKLYNNRTGQRFINAKFSEFFVFNTPMTSDQEFTIQQYLLSKWGA